MRDEAALARLAEQAVALQRQITRIEAGSVEQIHTFTAMIHEAEATVIRLTESMFVTYDALLKGDREKVALALDATKEAIGKAEVSTSKAIDKQETANNERFASVNEFRATLAQQALDFMTRREVAIQTEANNARMKQIEEQMKSLQIWQGNITGRFAFAAVAMTIIMAVIIWTANWATSK